MCIKVFGFSWRLLGVLILCASPVVSGCAAKQKSPTVSLYLQRADGAIERHDWEAAYRFLEDALVSKNQVDKSHALSLIERFPPLLQAALQTFSKDSLVKTVIEHGEGPGLAYERQRLAMFKVIAPPSDYAVAQENIDWAISNARLAEDAARKEQERLTAEAQRQKESLRIESERKKLKFLADLASAAQNARFTCQTKADCQKAFALTQVFISNNADMKIQVATETIIETFNPTEHQKIGIKAVKLPLKGDSADISLVVMCKDEANESSKFLCDMTRLRVYQEYPSFMRTNFRP